MLNFNDYINALKSNVYIQRVKLQFLRNEDESVYSEFTANVISGNLTVNNQNGIRRSCNLELANINNKYKINSDSLWINTKFKLWMGLQINGEDYFIPQGVFVLSNPEIIHDLSRNTINIAGSDKFSLLDGSNGGNLTGIYQIPLNSKVEDALKSLLTIAGDKALPIIQSTSVLTPYTLRADYSSNIGNIILELAGMLSYDCYYDENGIFIFESPKDDKIKASVWDYSVDEKQYLNSSHKYEFNKIYNTQTVVGTNIDGGTIYTTVSDTNLLSPTRIQLIGSRPAQPIVDTAINTLDLATQRANYELKKSIAIQETVSLTSIPMYHIKPNDVVTITDSDGGFAFKDRYVVQGFSLSLKSGEKMTLDLWKSRELS